MNSKTNLQTAVFNEYLMIKGHSESTRQTVIRTVIYFETWLIDQGIGIEAVSYSDVLAYVDFCKKKGNKPRTLQMSVNAIKHYYSFLLDRGEVTDNPCQNVDIKGVKRRILHELFNKEELEQIYQTFCASFPAPGGLGSKLSHIRNKVMLGLMIYQGIKTEELAKLKVQDIKLREGKVFIPGGRRSEDRELILEAHQLYDLMDYINETRKMILMLTGKTTDILFMSLGGGDQFHNMTDKILIQLKKQNPRIKVLKQIRASVITNWLNVHGLRKVQQMAGHRYVSSTENYKVNNMEDLKTDVGRYHPDL